MLGAFGKDNGAQRRQSADRGRGVRRIWPIPGTERGGRSPAVRLDPFELGENDVDYRVLLSLAQENVVGILTTSVVDVLSHVAIRARSQDVMLASCSDFDEFAKLDGLQGKTVVAKVDPSGSVAVEETTRKAGSGATQKAPRKALKLQAPELGTSKSPWALQEKEFTSGRVGKKALNLKTFRATLPKGCVG